jgi:hypothetical protein
MIQTDEGLQNDEELGRGARPAFAQNQVVGIFNMQSCDAAQKVDGRKQVLDIEQGHVPRLGLRGKRGFQGIGCTAMAAAGVVEHNCELTQSSPVSCS